MCRNFFASIQVLEESDILKSSRFNHREVDMAEKLQKLLIILPCYNEEEILPSTIKTMKKLLTSLVKEKKVSPESKICLVNDGSKDKTWEIISQTCAQNKMFAGIKLSRNFGHQSTIIAGMYSVDADLYVTIDADLQDNPECIAEMLKCVEEGAEVVYGIRKSRKTDSIFKRTSAQLYYRLLNLFGVDVLYNHADYRLMSRRAVETLKQFPERNLFLRATVPLLGFKTAQVYYDRTARTAGETKYPLNKMLALAWNGVSSFSIVPLRIVTFLGLFICFLSVLFLIYLFYRYSAKGTVVGWASLVTIITIFSGVQLLSLGIIGEYIAKIFVEAKKRPLFIVEETLNLDDKEKIKD